MLPLGRYMKRKLRAQVGRDEATPKSVQLKRSEEMRPLLVRQKSIEGSSLKKEIKNKFAGKAALTEALNKARTKEKKL